MPSVNAKKGRPFVAMKIVDLALGEAWGPSVNLALLCCLHNTKS